MQQSILNKSRKDKFILVLNLPEILRSIIAKERSNTSINLDSLQFSVWGGAVPKISVPAKTTNFMGQHAKMTSYHRPEYSDVTVKFTVDNNFNNWWVLWKWLDLLNGNKESKYNKNDLPRKDVKKIQDYTTNMSMFGLDEYNKKTIEFVYIKSFITELGEITYSYRDAEEAECSFTFAFNQLDVKLLDSTNND